MKSPFKMLTLTILSSCLIAAAVPVAMASSLHTVQSAPITSLVTQITPVNVTTKSVEDKTDLYTATLHIPVISGMADEQYQDQLNDILERHAMEDLTLIKKQATEEKAAAELANYTFRPYELMVDYKLQSAGGSDDDIGILSLTVETYSFTGGAHGGTRVDTYNVRNDEEATVLTLNELLGSDYKEQADAAVNQAIAADPDIYFTDEEGKFKGIDDTQAFYLEKGQAVLLFQQYAIAPYSTGIVKVKVSSQAEAGVDVEPVRIIPQGTEVAGALTYRETEQGVRLVPLRAVAEKLGYKVQWSNALASAEISKGALWTAITLGKDYYFYNKVAPIQLGTAPQIIGGFTYVPATFFTEILKLTVTTEKGTEALLISE